MTSFIELAVLIADAEAFVNESPWRLGGSALLKRLKAMRQCLLNERQYPANPGPEPGWTVAMARSWGCSHRPACATPEACGVLGARGVPRDSDKPAPARVGEVPCPRCKGVSPAKDDCPKCDTIGTIPAWAEGVAFTRARELAALEPPTTAEPERCTMGVGRPTIPGWRTVDPCVLPKGHNEDCVSAEPDQGPTDWICGGCNTRNDGGHGWCVNCTKRRAPRDVEYVTPRPETASPGHNLWSNPRKRGDDPALDAKLDAVAANMKARDAVVEAARAWNARICWEHTDPDDEERALHEAVRALDEKGITNGD